MKQQRVDVRPVDIWFAGHRPTGAEVVRQLGAMRDSHQVTHQTTITIIDDPSNIPEAAPSALMVVPPNATWARGRHHRPLGPKPLRNTQWPWGLPWLSPSERQIVDGANAELRQLINLIVVVLQQAPGTFVLLLHPEQLGPMPRGDPSSIWDLPELRKWARQTGMMRSATYQCRFQRTEYRCPIGVLSSHCLNSKWFDHGWPSIATHAPHYQGPLPRHCACGRKAHRPLNAPGMRIAHRADTSLLKDGFIRFLLGTIIRNITGQSIAELLRTGETPQRGVRDAHHDSWDSSDGQQTWVPSDCDSSSHSDSAADLRNRIHWDRELSDILGINTNARDKPPDNDLRQHLIDAPHPASPAQDLSEPNTVLFKKKKD